MTAVTEDGCLSEKQVDFLKGSSARVNLAEGSIRSGKTVVSLLRWLFFLAAAPTGGEFVMVGRTRDALFRNVIKPLQSPDLFGPLSGMTRYTNGASTAVILGHLVHLIGASDAKAERVIRGMTVAGAYVDEVTVIPEQFFTQLLGRMSVPGAQLFGTTNPDSPAHWLKKKFLDRIGQLPDWRSWHFVLDDNPALSEGFKASIKAEFTGLWYRRFIQGEWVVAEGAVFDMWDPKRHVLPWLDLPELRDLIAVGVDYGTTNPTAAVLLGITAETATDANGRTVDRPRLILVDEWRYEAETSYARWTDAQLSHGLRSWMAEAHTPYPTDLRPKWVIVDPSAASFRVQLQVDNVVGLVEADNDVLYGIRTLASLLSTGQFVVTDRCAGFLNEVPGYSWDPAATEKGEDKPVKVADHSLDAGRYAVTTTERFWRPQVQLLAARP